MKTSVVSNRLLPAAALALLATAVHAGPPRTPELTEGPFYPFNATNTLPSIPAGNRDNDLTRIAGAPAPAGGAVFLLSGVVRDLAGTPVANATVELWQTDAQGAYYHSGDRSGARDGAFQFYGEAVTDKDGRYSFRTVLPGLYTGRIRHFHFKIKHGGAAVLTSQFIFEDERAKFKSDGVTARLSGEALEAIVLQPRSGTDASGAAALLATKDIVIDPAARAGNAKTR